MGRQVELSECLVFGGNGEHNGGWSDFLRTASGEREGLLFALLYLNDPDNRSEDRRWVQIVNEYGEIIYDSREVM